MTPDDGARVPSGRKRVDWESVEAEYRTGAFSIRQLGAKYGCSDTAIRLKAKELGWERDLSEAVRRATEARLLRIDIRTPNPREDASIVAEAADTRAAVVLRHRRAVSRDWDRLEQIGAKLDALIVAADGRGPVGEVQDIAESMARTRARLIPLERQAFGLTDKDGGQDYAEVRTIRRVICDPRDSDAEGVRAAP